VSAAAARAATAEATNAAGATRHTARAGTGSRAGGGTTWARRRRHGSWHPASGGRDSSRSR